MRTLRLMADVARVGPAGFVVLAGPIVVGACLVVAVAARKHRTLAGVASFGALGAYAAFAIAACAVYVGSRWRFLDAILAPNPDAWRLMWLFEYALATEIFAGAASLVLVPLLALVLAIEWTRRARAGGAGAALPVAFVTSTASVVWVVALLALVDGRALGERAVAECQGEECYTFLLGTPGITDLVRSAVVLLGVVGATAVLIAARSAPSMSFSARAACASSLAIGALAFFATRAAAEDAEHPLPWDAWPQLILMMPDDRLPAAPESCGPVPDAPILTVHEGRTMAGGTPITDVEDFLSERKRLAAAVTGRRFRGELSIAADADTPARVIAPYVEAARRNGYVDVRGIRRLPPRTLETRTLGRIARHQRYCAMALPGDPRDGTWDNWAR